MGDFPSGEDEVPFVVEDLLQEPELGEVNDQLHPTFNRSTSSRS
jgi:hypothetical protein